MDDKESEYSTYLLKNWDEALRMIDSPEENQRIKFVTEFSDALIHDELMKVVEYSTRQPRNFIYVIFNKAQSMFKDKHVNFTMKTVQSATGLWDAAYYISWPLYACFKATDIVEHNAVIQSGNLVLAFLRSLSRLDWRFSNRTLYYNNCFDDTAETNENKDIGGDTLTIADFPELCYMLESGSLVFSNTAQYIEILSSLLEKIRYGLHDETIIFKSTVEHCLDKQQWHATCTLMWPAKMTFAIDHWNKNLAKSHACALALLWLKTLPKWIKTRYVTCYSDVVGSFSGAPKMKEIVEPTSPIENFEDLIPVLRNDIANYFTPRNPADSVHSVFRVIEDMIEIKDCLFRTELSDTFCDLWEATGCLTWPTSVTFKATDERQNLAERHMASMVIAWLKSLPKLLLSFGSPCLDFVEEENMLQINDLNQSETMVDFPNASANVDDQEKDITDRFILNPEVVMPMLKTKEVMQGKKRGLASLTNFYNRLRKHLDFQCGTTVDVKYFDDSNIEAVCKITWPRDMCFKFVQPVTNKKRRKILEKKARVMACSAALSWMKNLPKLDWYTGERLIYYDVVMPDTTEQNSSAEMEPEMEMYQNYLTF